MIKYHHAKDKDGKIVSIKEAHSGETYYCIGCGHEMIAKKGKIKEHHFSHKQTLEYCNPETYLHKYAKSYIKNLFDNNEHLFIEYDGYCECCKITSCKFNGYKHDFDNDYHDCCKEKKFKYDLKEYYDTCELEIEYNGFVADVLLWNSKIPNREPCFIEVAVTHFCEEEKIKSGIRIIEIAIPKGTDHLDSLTVFSESDEYEHKKRNRKQISILFYNFKNNEVSKKAFEIYGIPVFYINNNGRGQVETHPRCCNFYGLGHLEDESSFEIHFSNGYFAYRAGVAIANLEGYTVKNCWVCKYHWYSQNYSTHNCNKNIQIVSPSNAQQCEAYLFDKWKALSLKREADGQYQIIHPIDIP